MTDATNLGGPGFDAEALLAEAGWVRDLAVRLCGDADMAGDVAQGALVLAMEKQPATRGGLRPWLSRVVSTLAQHERRGRGRRRHYEHDVQRAKPAGSPAADELVLRVEAQQRIATAVCGLPQPYRDVLLRRYYDGQSFEAIAEAQGQAASTVRSQVTRGIAKLRAEFEEPDQLGGSAPAIFALAAGAAAGPAGSAAKPGAGSVGPILGKGASRAPNWALRALATGAVCAIAVSLFVGPSEDEPGLVPFAVPQRMAAVRAPELVGPAEPPKDARAAAAATTDAPPVLDSAPNQSGRGARLRIVDKGGHPIPGARLVWAPGGGEPEIVALADRNGIAQLVFDGQPFAQELAMGWHVPLLAQAPGFAERTIEWLPQADNMTPHDHVELVPGCSLTGLVLDGDGQPISGAEVASSTGFERKPGYDPAGQYNGPAPNAHRVRTRTDAGGRFRIEGLNPGEHQLWLRSDTSLWQRSELLEVAAGFTLDLGSIALEEAGADHTVAGQVTQGGLPVAGAVVRIEARTENLMASTRTGPDGTFRFAVPTAKAVAVVAWSADSRGAASPCQAAKVGETVALELEPTHRVEVTVIDEAGRPMPKVAILPRLANQGVLSRVNGPQALPGALCARTDGRGVAELILPVGQVELLAIREGFDPSEKFHTDVPGPRSVVLRMKRSRDDGAGLKHDPDGASRWGDPRPSVKIEGSLRIDGKAAAGWKVDLHEVGRRFDGQIRGMPAKVSETGRFQGIGLAGDYLLVARGELQGQDVRVVREVRLGGKTKSWTGNIRTGWLDVIVPKALGACRLVRGHPDTGTGSEVLLSEVSGRSLRVEAPVGMHTLQARRPDGTWRFVKIVDVFPRDQQR